MCLVVIPVNQSFYRPPLIMGAKLRGHGWEWGWVGEVKKKKIQIHLLKGAIIDFNPIYFLPNLVTISSWSISCLFCVCAEKIWCSYTVLAL